MSDDTEPLAVSIHAGTATVRASAQHTRIKQPVRLQALDVLDQVNFVEIDGHVAGGSQHLLESGGSGDCILEYGPQCHIDHGPSSWGSFFYELSGLADAVECVQGDLASCGWAVAGLTPGGKLARAARVTKKTWRPSEFRDIRVFQLKHLDLKLEDARGRTNLERMKAGLAPIGPDGKPVNLHHLTQSGASALAEVTDTMHVRYRSSLHINPGNAYPSGVDRKQFAKFRRAYWKNRYRQLTN